MTKRIGNVRWAMAILLGVGIVVNYLDRVNLNVTSGTLEKQFGIAPWQMGIILSCYLWTYTLLQIPIGTWLDKFGVKWLIRVGTIIWTITTFLTALVSGFWPLLLCRLLLGVGEAPSFPGSSKATGYWFPVKERGLATTSFDAAAKFSNVIGTPLVAITVFSYGWRAAFILTGILSLVYLLIFWFAYRDPSESKRLQKEEHAYIQEGGAQEEHVRPAASGVAILGYLFRQKKVWGLALGFAAYNYSFNLFLTWLPNYLQTSLHVSVLTSGWYTVIPWSIATLTDIFIGGVLVDSLIKRGHDSTKVRRTLVVIGMLLGLAVIGAAFTKNPIVATFWISIALGGLAFAAPIAWSVPSLIAPKGSVGSVGSIMNMFGNAAGIVAPIVAGIVISTTASFALNFLIAGGILILGILCFIFLLGKIEQLPEPENLMQRESTGITTTKAD